MAGEPGAERKVKNVMSRTTVHSTKSKESTSSASEPSHHGKASKSSTSTVNANGVKNLLAQVTAVAGPALALTGKDRQRAVRLRKGGEKVIPTITALSEQFGLVVPSFPTSAITANVTQANSLVALHKQLVTATKQVSDAMFQADSKSWEGATVHYSVLKRLAKTNGDSRYGARPRLGILRQEVACRGESRRGEAGTSQGRQGAKGYRDGSGARRDPERASARGPGFRSGSDPCDGPERRGPLLT